MLIVVINLRLPLEGPDPSWNDCRGIYMYVEILCHGDSIYNSRDYHTILALTRTALLETND